jgi:hypothetical protein
MLKHHKWKLFFVGMGANVALIASLAVADVKVLAEINWLDVLSGIDFAQSPGRTRHAIFKFGIKRNFFGRLSGST